MVGLDELLLRLEAVDARDVLEVGALGRLVLVAEPHQHLARPGVVVVRGHVDHARREADALGVDRGLDLLQLASSLDGAIDVRVEAHEVARVGRADLDDPVDLAPPELLADRQRLEVGPERHPLGDLAEDELVAAVGVARFGQRGLDDPGHPADSTEALKEPSWRANPGR